ncbi:hypothetical protein EV646_10868 [Kribbella antiqua]|uniref:Uncharacterized protein n=1 Tax=Kribbella antiqua TaxID=2512217 RepID=A0A4R2IM48_9ACTN|nr:hypothetical protein [Kribbella antiqua]TCO45446.1 hypothetical protein EV646_10868 [Kribbella antiqua]
MNPTDEVDELLTRAGARWRADQPSAPEPDLDHILGGHRRPRRWVPALAAASVAAIAAAALIVLPDGGKEPLAGTSQSVAESKQPASAQGEQANDDLLIRPGDKVQVSGQVIAAPGKAPVFCPPLPTPSIGYLPGKEPAPTCAADFAVTLKGVDLDKLTGVKMTRGVRTGTATLIGTWGDQSIDVQEQKAPAAPVGLEWPPLPCAAPTGGWVSKPNNVNSAAVTAFMDAHADQLFGPVLFHPKGHGRNAPVVTMIGVAHGDLATLKAAFEKVYDGNLCVAPVLLSRADIERISQAVGQLMSRQELGIWSAGGSAIDGGPVDVSLLAYTEQVKAALAPIGLDLLKVEPAVKPVR